MKTLNIATIQKFMSAADFDALLSNYMKHKTGPRIPRPANDEDREIYAAYKGGEEIHMIAKRLGKSPSKVSTSILKAAR